MYTIIKTMVHNEYFQSFVILLGAVIGAKVFLFILNKYVKRIVRQTKSDIDDMLLEILRKPFYVLIILGGSFFSLKFLSLLAPYSLWIDRIFFVCIVLVISLSAKKILSILVSRWFEVQKRFEKTPQLISKILTVIIFLIAFLMILGYFKIEITPLLATLGLGSLAIGLALQATLSNFFAGLHIITDQPINIGDFIELPDANVSGYVEDIGWRSTKIKTLPNQIVVVPNAKLAESIIVNNFLPEQDIAALVQVGVAYGSDLKKVEEVTIDVARRIQKTVPGAVKNFEPFIRYHTFGDSNINFTVILRVEQFVDRYIVIHEFIKELKERYDKEGIEISWPVRKIYQAK